MSNEWVEIEQDWMEQDIQDERFVWDGDPDALAWYIPTEADIRDGLITREERDALLR